MTNPITPPPELVQQWLDTLFDEGGLGIDPHKLSMGLAARAAQWGADQELEACCEWFADDVVSEVVSVVADLRAARRPKPLSLKERAIKDLAEIGTHYICPGAADLIKTIRAALEALPDD